MNRQDLILSLIVIAISCVLIVTINIFKKDVPTKAYVYYDNKLIKTIDLSLNGNREYIVSGYNGNVVIETKQNQIRVKEENSPLNICSKQGWVSSSLETIVCLPNKIIIKIEALTDDVDAVIR